MQENSVQNYLNHIAWNHEFAAMKMFTRLFSFMSFLVLSSAFQSGEPSHAWFTTKGKSTDWDQVLKACEKADIVLFGELHNDVQSHWFEKRLAAHLIAQHGDKLVLGCEMLEADDQIIVIRES